MDPDTGGSKCWLSFHWSWSQFKQKKTQLNNIPKLTSDFLSEKYKSGGKSVGEKYKTWLEVERTPPCSEFIRKKQHLPRICYKHIPRAQKQSAKIEAVPSPHPFVWDLFSCSAQHITTVDRIHFRLIKFTPPLGTVGILMLCNPQDACMLYIYIYIIPHLVDFYMGKLVGKWTIQGSYLGKWL